MTARGKMRGCAAVGLVLITSFLLGACGQQDAPGTGKAAALGEAPAAAPAPVPAAPLQAAPAVEQKIPDTAPRQAQQIDLQKQAEAFTLGPAMGLSKVTEALIGQQPEKARRHNEELQKRYPDSIEAKGAKAALGE